MQTPEKPDETWQAFQQALDGDCDKNFFFNEKENSLVIEFGSVRENALWFSVFVAIFFSVVSIGTGHSMGGTEAKYWYAAGGGILLLGLILVVFRKLVNDRYLVDGHQKVIFLWTRFAGSSHMKQLCRFDQVKLVALDPVYHMDTDKEGQLTTQNVSLLLEDGKVVRLFRNGNCYKPESSCRIGQEFANLLKVPFVQGEKGQLFTPNMGTSKNPHYSDRSGSDKRRWVLFSALGFAVFLLFFKYAINLLTGETFE